MFIYEIICSQSFNFHSKQIKIFVLKYSEYRPVLSKNVIGFLNETEIGGFGMKMISFARNLVFLLVFIHLLLLVVLLPHVPVFFGLAGIILEIMSCNFVFSHSFHT